MIKLTLTISVITLVVNLVMNFVVSPFGLNLKWVEAMALGSDEGVLSLTQAWVYTLSACLISGLALKMILDLKQEAFSN